MDDRRSKPVNRNAQPPTEGGGSDLGGGIGCGFIILSVAVAVTLIIWAFSGFPKFWLAGR